MSFCCTFEKEKVGLEKGMSNCQDILVSKHSYMKRRNYVNFTFTAMVRSKKTSIYIMI